MKKYLKCKRNLTIIAIAALFAYAWGFAGPSEHSIRSRVVALTSEHGLCSGEQIHAPSGADYILTAGHCRPLAKVGDSITVTTEDGRKLERKIIAEDPEADLLLLEGIPHMRGIDIARSMRGQEHVRTFTHGNRFPTYKTEGHLIAYEAVASEADDKDCESGMPKYQRKSFMTIFGAVDVCVLDVVEMATDALIVPGSSGGPIVNDSGQLVGVVSMGGGGFGYMVPAIDINKFIRNY